MDAVPVRIERAQYMKVDEYCVQRGCTKTYFVRELIGKFFRDLAREKRQTSTHNVVTMPERKSI